MKLWKEKKVKPSRTEWMYNESYESLQYCPLSNSHYRCCSTVTAAKGYTVNIFDATVNNYKYIKTNNIDTK